jgi:hypothetical protein
MQMMESLISNQFAFDNSSSSCIGYVFLIFYLQLVPTVSGLP